MEVAFRDAAREAKERGQAIFLSSHILSEVEALCDRVGILREGRLVDEGTLQRAPPPRRADRGRHVRRRAARAARARRRAGRARGPERAALRGRGQRRTAHRRRSPGTPVATLTSREPSLEEIFLHHYDGADGDAAAAEPARAQRGARSLDARGPRRGRIRLRLRGLRLRPAGRATATPTRRLADRLALRPQLRPTTPACACSTASPHDVLDRRRLHRLAGRAARWRSPRRLRPAGRRPGAARPRRRRAG